MDGAMKKAQNWIERKIYNLGQARVRAAIGMAGRSEPQRGRVTSS